jgi:hypothetical protein
VQSDSKEARTRPVRPPCHQHQTARIGWIEHPDFNFAKLVSLLGLVKLCGQIRALPRRLFRQLGQSSGAGRNSLSSQQDEQKQES